MRALSNFDFVRDAIHRHWRAYACAPLRVIISPETYYEVCADHDVRKYLIVGPGELEKIHGVPICVLPGATPRLMRFDGVIEEM
ncbi:hypothetical protein BX589_102366 [Paraburkholderia fungorum]|nr:hypothetical protein BX589_102366 [Paraburkholderia fungorum]